MQSASKREHISFTDQFKYNFLSVQQIVS